MLTPVVHPRGVPETIGRAEYFECPEIGTISAGMCESRQGKKGGDGHGLYKPCGSKAGPGGRTPCETGRQVVDAIQLGRSRRLPVVQAAPVEPDEDDEDEEDEQEVPAPVVQPAAHRPGPPRLEGDAELARRQAISSGARAAFQELVEVAENAKALWLAGPGAEPDDICLVPGCSTLLRRIRKGTGRCGVHRRMERPTREPPASWPPKSEEPPDARTLQLQEHIERARAEDAGAPVSDLQTARARLLEKQATADAWNPRGLTDEQIADAVGECHRRLSLRELLKH